MLFFCVYLCLWLFSTQPPLFALARGPLLHGSEDGTLSTTTATRLITWGKPGHIGRVRGFEGMWGLWWGLWC